MLFVFYTGTTNKNSILIIFYYYFQKMTCVRQNGDITIIIVTAIYKSNDQEFIQDQTNTTNDTI